ncbi:MAG: hypothetical protein ACYDEB_08925 [Dehalococcoidia bacterium]
MNLKQPAAITDIEDAATVRWLARALGRARAEAHRPVSDDALDRMRAQVFGDAPRRKIERQRIAA